MKTTNLAIYSSNQGFALMELIESEPANKPTNPLLPFGGELSRIDPAPPQFKKLSIPCTDFTLIFLK